MNAKTALFTSLCILTFLCVFSITRASGWNSKPFPGPVLIENKGQFPNETPELGRIGFGIQAGDPALIGERGVCIYILNWNSPTIDDESEEAAEEMFLKKRPASERFRRINMIWDGANPHPRVRTELKREDYFTCIVPSGSGGFSGLQLNGYHRIIYEELYNKIDLIIETDESRPGFRYSFRLHPGADPNQIRISFSGDIKGKIESDYNKVEIHTDFGYLTHTELKAFTGVKKNILCDFDLKGNSLGFKLGAAMDITQELIIDPWVVTNLANLSTNGIGYDVDYDYNGNLYVYGGGDPMNNGANFKVSKYNSTGVLQWTFLGAVAPAAWLSIGDATINVPGNFIVDKPLGKTYIAQSFDVNGARMVRLDANGSYDNFVSLADPDYLETWDLVFDCNTGEVFACGGGTSSDINFGIVNTNTGFVSSANVTGVFGACCQDIANATNDFSGNIYVVFSDAVGLSPGIGNHIYKVNATRNGNLWSQPTGYTTLDEANNKPFFPNTATNFTGNGANLLSVNDNYLYYYDGANLKAFNKNTGNPVGIPAFVGGVQLEQTGIAVDNNDNIYLGGTGVILAYNFNGVNFIPLANIPLGAGLMNNAVHDIRYSFTDNALYVTGTGFTGVYLAIHSVLTNSINITANSSCAGVANASVTTNISGSSFEYLWFNSAGVLVRNQITTILSDSISGLAPGTYIVRVQVAGGCGGPAAVDTFTIGMGGFTFSINTVQPSCLNPTGGTASVSNLSGGSGPFTYSWNTNPNQSTPTATGLAGGSYTCLVTDAAGCSYSQTTVLNPVVPINVSFTASDVTCNGGADGSATAIPQTGTAPYTYSWQPGGAATATVTNLSVGTYNCTVTDADGCTAVISVTLGQPAAVQVSVVSNPAAACVNDSVTLTASGGAGYLWSNGATTSFIEVPVGPQTVYMVTVTDTQGCTASGTASVIINPAPVAAFTAGNVCLGDALVFTNNSVISGGGNLLCQWDFGDGGSSLTCNPVYTYSTTGIKNVWLTVSSIYNCRDSVSLQLEVWPKPFADFIGDPLSGCPVLNVDFQSLSTSVDSITSYYWYFSNGLTRNVSQTKVDFISPGRYDAFLQVTSIYGCKDDTLFKNYVEVFDEPVARFDFTPTTTTELFPEIFFIDYSLGASSWIWDFGDSSGVSFVREPVHTYVAPGSYTIWQTVVNNKGCRDSLSQRININRDNSLFVPNTFTPNYDGYNDEFRTYGYNITGFNLSIFNRWGMKIFWTDDIKRAWDGTYEGAASPQGVYVYLVDYTDVQGQKRILTGKLHLIR